MIREEVGNLEGGSHLRFMAQTEFHLIKGIKSKPLNVKFETFPKRELRQHRQFSKLEFLSSALRMLINCVIPLQEILSFVLYKIMSV